MTAIERIAAMWQMRHSRNELVLEYGSGLWYLALREYRFAIRSHQIDHYDEHTFEAHTLDELTAAADAWLTPGIEAK